MVSRGSPGCSLNAALLGCRGGSARRAATAGSPAPGEGKLLCTKQAGRPRWDRVALARARRGQGWGRHRE